MSTEGKLHCWWPSCERTQDAVRLNVGTCEEHYTLRESWGDPTVAEKYAREILLAEARVANARANERDAELTKLRGLVKEYVAAREAWNAAGVLMPGGPEDLRCRAAWAALRGAAGVASPGHNCRR